MTVFSREEEVRAISSAFLSLILFITTIISGFSGSPIWVGLFIISVAFLIPIIRIFLEQTE